MALRTPHGEKPVKSPAVGVAGSGGEWGVPRKEGQWYNRRTSIESNGVPLMFTTTSPTVKGEM